MVHNAWESGQVTRLRKFDVKHSPSASEASTLLLCIRSNTTVTALQHTLYRLTQKNRGSLKQFPQKWFHIIAHRSIIIQDLYSVINARTSRRRPGVCTVLWSTQGARPGAKRMSVLASDNAIFIASKWLNSQQQTAEIITDDLHKPSVTTPTTTANSALVRDVRKGGVKLTESDNVNNCNKCDKILLLGRPT